MSYLISRPSLHGSVKLLVNHRGEERQVTEKEAGILSEYLWHTLEDDEIPNHEFLEAVEAYKRYQGAIDERPPTNSPLWLDSANDGDR